MLRMILSIFLIGAVLSSTPPLSLHAASRILDTAQADVADSETFIQGIDLYMAGDYQEAIAQFEAVIAYFEATGNTSQIPLAKRYIQNADKLLAAPESEPESGATSQMDTQVAARTKNAAIPEPDVVAQAATPTPEIVDAAATITATASLTETAAVTTTVEITENISSESDAPTTEPTTTEPTTTEPTTAETAASETTNEPEGPAVEAAAEASTEAKSPEAVPIALPIIICPDATVDEGLTVDELTNFAISFVESGDQLRSEKKFAEATTAYCNGLVIVADLGDVNATANTLNKLAEAYRGAGQDAETVAAYTTAAELSEAAGLSENAANTLTALGRYHRSTKRPSEAIEIFSAAIDWYQEVGAEEKIANVLTQLAEAYKDVGAGTNAVAAFEEAAAIYTALDNIAALAGTLEAFARYESSVQRFEQAIALNQEALELRRTLGEDNRTAGTLKQLADSYQKISSDQAIGTYEEAIELYLTIDDPKNAAGILEGLGRNAQATEDFAQAISYFNEAVELRDEVGDDNAIANSLNQLAGAYLKNGDEVLAFAAYDESVTIYLALDNFKKSADIVEAIARTDAAAQRFDNAIARYEQAIEIRRTAGDDVATANTLNQLAKTLQAAGDETTMVAVSEESAALFQAAGESEKAEAALIPTSTPTPTPTPTTFFVTPTPIPIDIFEAATRSAQATAQVDSVGTPTPIPPNLKVARIVVQPNLADYSNEATAVALQALATIQVQTTGIPEGFAAWTATPRTAIVYVTPTPRAPDIFAAATVAAQMTSDAQTYGTATPLPPNWRIARIGVLPNLSDYQNPATAVALSQLATAIAQTTGTPEGWEFWTATPRPPVVYVTPTPPAADIFAAATIAAQITVEAQTYGTATPLPPNWKVARVRVIPNLSDYGNQATAVALSQFATAVFQTTGTPEGQVYWTATPRPLGGGKEPTPIFLSPSELTATSTPSPTPAVPQQLVGKILFLTDMDGERRPSVYAMNPDGTGLTKLTSDEFYQRAIERNRSSADRRFRAFNCRDGCGPHGRLQIWYADAEWNSQSQLTFFGTGGNSWDMVWSPTGSQVAFVDNQTGGDEIYVVNLGEWPAKRLTENTWEWDHHPTWSPDGTQLVFSSNRDIGRRQLWIMDADGGNQRRLTDLPSEAYNPVWVLYGDD